MSNTSNTSIRRPAAGPTQTVPCHFDAVFDWTYEHERADLLALYEKGKAATWNASDLDWSRPVDLWRLVGDVIGRDSVEPFNQLLQPPWPLSTDEAVEMQVNMTAWMLSQFMHGEQGALLATAKIVQSAPLGDAKWYAANQVADEARHVEVYHRYLTEKLGRSFEVNGELQTLLAQILSDRRWDMTYLGMQIIVEGLALAAFGLMRLQVPDEPLLHEITSRIMGDEARHVAFGVLSLEGLYRELDSAELAEREEFVIEAVQLMRDRLLMEQVYARMGWDPDDWIAWAVDTPFMRAFRQMLFAKIVPNLRRLGLLTPRVRTAFAKMDVLRFAELRDSTEDPEVVPPQELVDLLSALRNGGGAAVAPVSA